MKAAQNEQELQALTRLLRKRAMTARQISELTGCSKVVAYMRIRALIKRGTPITRKRVRDGRTGPKSVSYSVSRG